MKTAVAALLCAAILSVAELAGAQPLQYDHVHMGSPDPAASVAWWLAHLGARPGASPDRVLFGPTIIAFNNVPAPQPSHGGAIDHIAIAVSDPAATARELVAAGATRQSGEEAGAGPLARVFVVDPWGIMIELIGDHARPGLHHVHLRVPDPDASYRWYLEMFGGSREKLDGRIDGVRYGDVWLLADASAPAETPAPSAGRAIDHLGWRPANLDTTAADLKRKGVTFSAEPRDGANGLRIAFVEGPAGVRIEVVQRPRP